MLTLLPRKYLLATSVFDCTYIIVIAFVFSIHRMSSLPYFYIGDTIRRVLESCIGITIIHDYLLMNPFINIIMI